MSRPDNVVDGMNGSYVEGVCPVSFLLLYKPDCTLTTGNTNQWKVNTSSPGSPSGSEAMCELFTEDSFGNDQKKSHATDGGACTPSTKVQ